MNKKTFEIKIASGAFGFKGLGYPEIIFNPLNIFELLRTPMREWPKMLRVFAGLIFEWLLLATGIFPLTKSIFTMKTLTWDKLPGNPLRAWIRIIRGGSVNAVGLHNPGRHRVSKFILSLNRRGIKPVVNIAPNTPHEAKQMMRLLLKHIDNITAVEISPGCPNTEEMRQMFKHPQRIVDIVHAARGVCQGRPCVIFLKLSHAHDWRHIMLAVDHLVDGYELFNSVPWSMKYPAIPSPLAEFGGGGISGPIIFNDLCRMLPEARELTKKHIFACGGISSMRDVTTVRELGADGASIGLACLTNILEVRRIVNKNDADKKIAEQKPLRGTKTAL